MTGEQIRSLQPALTALLQRFRHCFKRIESLGHWRRYITGLMMDLQRKSIEPIAIATDVPVRTLQEFLAFFAWDHERVDQMLRVMVAEEYGSDNAIGVFDASGHPKSGGKTPGTQRQWCGQTGKLDNCVVGQHLLYTNNHSNNPFNCILASDLFLPEKWSEDRTRCREAGIPDDVVHRPKWQIALEQLETANKSGIEFEWITFDENYGKAPSLWFDLDRRAQKAIGEVPSDFRCWAKRPWYRSYSTAHASKQADNICRLSPIFTTKKWKRIRVKEVTHCDCIWDVKAARVHMVGSSNPKAPVPTDRKYWLIIAKKLTTGEIKYFVSNAPARTTVEDLLIVAFARWHLEKWFERAKQETGFGDFEIRTYTSLIRHWLSSRMAMFFLASETERLRGEKHEYYLRAGVEGDTGDDLEPVVSLIGSDRESCGAVRLLSGAERDLVPQP